MTTIAGPAGQLHVDDGGIDGLPLLLLHSYAGSSAHWKAQLAHLRRRRRALAMDLRGHGRSDPPSSGDYSVPALAEDVAAVAQALALRRFVLVGHSMGGAAAAAYAGRHPGQVAGLVLAGAPGKSSGDQAQQIMGALRADYDKVMAGYWNSLLEGAEPPVREMLLSDMRGIGREASLAMIAAVFDFDPLPALARYPGPKLIIDTPHGDNPAALYRQLPEVSRKVIAGTSHWPHLDKPQEFNRLLDEFLAWLA
ncbi:MAG TPA: alpha/beta hydrolase [Ramlibacter sp.]|nr:alpha/beta hydrolase [Ramlibacter sp.]